MSRRRPLPRTVLLPPRPRGEVCRIRARIAPSSRSGSVRADDASRAPGDCTSSNRRIEEFEPCRRHGSSGGAGVSFDANTTARCSRANMSQTERNKAASTGPATKPGGTEDRQATERGQQNHVVGHPRLTTHEDGPQDVVDGPDNYGAADSPE